MLPSLFLLFVVGLVVLLPLVVVGTTRLQERVDRWYVQRELAQEVEVDLQALAERIVARAGRVVRIEVGRPVAARPAAHDGAVPAQADEATAATGAATSAVMRVPVYRYAADGSCSLDAWTVHLN